MTVTISGTSGITTPGLTDTGNATIAGTLGVTGSTTAPNLQGPAFSAYQSVAQSVSANTFTKVQLQTKEYDTATCFDATTNYRFTPNVAGYYQVNGACSIANGVTITIYKNGVEFKRGIQGYSTNYTQIPIVSSQMYLNGSTDYIELFIYQGSGTQNTATGFINTYFQAALVRSA